MSSISTINSQIEELQNKLHTLICLQECMTMVPSNFPQNEEQLILLYNPTKYPNRRSAMSYPSPMPFIDNDNNIYSHEFFMHSYKALNKCDSYDYKNLYNIDVYSKFQQEYRATHNINYLIFLYHIIASMTNDIHFETKKIIDKHGTAEHIMEKINKLRSFKNKLLSDLNNLSEIVFS